MLADSSLIAFLGATDREAALHFYGDLLGLRLTGDGPFALEFDSGGSMLRITFVAEVRAAPYTVMGWRVRNIASLIAGLSEKGIELERFTGLEQDLSGVWTAPDGARVAWFRDPDGNLLSLTEWPSPV